MRMPIVKKYSDLSAKKKAFVEFYIKSGDVADSVFAAGFKQGCDKTSKKERMLADSLGRRMLKDPLVHDYIAMNKPLPLPAQGVIDEPAIVERMFLIMMGRTQRTAFTKKGDPIIEEPSFRDQTEAAKVLLMIKKMQDKQIPVEQRGVAISKRLDELIASTQLGYETEGNDE